MSINWEDSVLKPCAAVFGETEQPATYYPPDDSEPYPVVPIFDEAYREIIVLDVAAPTSDAMPVVGINASQFRAPPAQDAELFIPRARNGAGQRYLVKEVRPDGHGNYKLMLTEAELPE